MATKVYKYGCLAPTVNGEVIEQQIARAHQYQHQLVELERARRDAYREARRRLVGDYEAAEQAYEHAQGAEQVAKQRLRAAKSASRSRKAPQELKDAVREARAARQQASADLKALRVRAKASPELEIAAEQIAARAVVLQKALRAVCGVYWGTYIMIEEAVRRASGGTAPPAFRRWTGGGRVGVQIQGGLPTLAVTHQHGTLVQVDPLPEHTWDRRRDRRRAYTTLRLRVGSEGREPVWAHVPLLMHQPLPLKGVVKRVALTRKRRGYRDHWTVEFTVVEPDPEPAASPEVIAFNFGWTRLESGALRAAYWRDSRGAAGTIEIPPHIPGALEHARGLRALQDRLFDAVRPKLATVRDAAGAPPWLRQAADAWHAWRSHKRLAGVVRRWACERFDGDAALFDIAKQWLDTHEHLYQWEVDEVAKAVRRRTEVFRVAAARLLPAYGTVLLDNTDFSRLARRADPDRDEELEQAQRRQRMEAAPGDLRLALTHAAHKRGIKVVSCDPRNITRQCPDCGSLHDYDADDRWHRCPDCGRAYDRDHKAALNLLRRAGNDQASAAE